MSLRTPLARVRGLGSAKAGTEHWWHQRVSSIAALPLTLFLIAFVVFNLGADRAELIAAVRHPLIALGLALSIATLVWHMQLGMQVIVEDYVHGAARLALLLVNTFIAIAIAAVALYAVVAMSFG